MAETTEAVREKAVGEMVTQEVGHKSSSGVFDNSFR